MIRNAPARALAGDAVKVVDGPFPPGRLVRVSRAPRLYVMDAFATDDEIDSVKAVGDATDELDAVGIAVTRGDAGYSADLPALDDTLASLGRRVESLVGRGDLLDDSLRFRRYAVGEFHRRHTDAVCPVEGLHLVVTALLCLDEPAAGGETLFPHAEGGALAVRHRRGRVVVWCNYAADGTVDRTAVHEGLPVREGTKATLGKFLHRPIADAGVDLDAALDLAAA